MKIIAGSSNKSLATNLSQTLNVPIVDCELSHFANGEKKIQVKGKLQGENVILVQDFSKLDTIMEFLLITDALERLGARHVNLVMPWMAYSLQDKVFREGEPISAKVVANLISNAFIKRVFVLELHNTSTPGFFSIPTHHLSTIKIYADYVKKNFDLENAVIASPDFGGLKRARTFADILGLNLVNIDKHRDLNTGKIVPMGLHGGKVQDKIVFVYDDVINGGSTVIESAKFLKDNGAGQVHFLSPHGPLVAGAEEKIENCPIDSVVVTNSMEHENLTSKFVELDITNIFAEELKDWM